MKVLMIEPLGDGGIAHYTFNLANALSKVGVNVVLFTRDGYELKKSGCQFTVYENMFKLARRLVRFFPSIDRETGIFQDVRRGIKLLEYPANVINALCVAIRERVDLVHFQSVNEIELIMIFVLKAYGFRVVFTIHNVMPRHGKLKLYHKKLFRFMYKLCNEIIIHTENGKREIAELFEIEPRKVSLIPHGDYKFFLRNHAPSGREAKRGLGIPERRKTILFFGAIRRNKGLERILFALPEIKRKVPDITLMIVGEPCEDYRRYRKIIEDLRLESNVFEILRYVGNDEVGSYFSAADIVVLPYEEVTGSGVLQIAYAFGKPVVATDLGGFREAIVESRNGYLVPLGDVRALASRAVDIISDSKKTAKFGKYSRFLSDTQYSWGSVAASTMNLYSRVAKS